MLCSDERGEDPDPASKGIAARANGLAGHPATPIELKAFPALVAGRLRSTVD